MPVTSSSSISKSLKSKARRELNEKSETVDSFIERFKILIADDGELICPQQREFLIRFLRARKFRLDESLKLLRDYYEMRRRNLALFENLTPEYLNPFLSHKLQIILKERDEEGRQVFIFRAGIWNPAEVNLDEIFRCNYICLEEMTSSPETQINGITAIVDFRGFSFFQAKYFTPKHAIRMVHILQGSFPCRFQEFHLVNQPSIFHWLFSIVRPFLSDKLKSRIHIHGKNFASLHNFIRPEILPDFLGGFNTSWEVDCDNFLTKLMKKNCHYKEQLQYGFRL